MSETGSRVERTGIALVHEGEVIGPAPGSEAAISPAGPPATVVHYYFPVQVEVVGSLDDEAVRQVTERVYDELQRELTSRL